jgi:hypothetical protein
VHQPKGLGNGSGQVGHNLMETLAWNSSGLVRGMAQQPCRLPLDAICLDFNAPNAISRISGGCRCNSSAQGIGFIGPIAYASQVVAGFGSQLKNGLTNSIAGVLSVGATGEFLPNEDAYIDLEP